MGESKIEETEILELANWIDKNEKLLIRWRDAFYHLGWLVLLLSAIIIVLIGTLIIMGATNSEKVIVTISIVAVLLAFISMVTQVSERSAIEARMKHALRIRTFNEEEKPLLKALLKIKSKNREQKLSTLYFLDKEDRGDTFTKRKLVEILCR